MTLKKQQFVQQVKSFKQPKKMQQYKGWKDELQSLINANKHIRMNGKVSSNETQQKLCDFLFMYFYFLRENGYACDPHNLKQKHIQLFCDHLAGKGNDAKVRSAATIQTYLYFLNLFCRWIGKDGMVGDTKQYFADPNILKRSYAATTDKSWEGNGVDVQAKIDEISVNYPWVAAQILVEHAFGLRRKESVSLRPYMNFIEGNLHIVSGGKGGKNRIIPIETDYQRDVSALAISMVGKTSKELKEPLLNLKQNLSKTSRVCTKYGITKKALGVTRHGNRCGYAINFMLSKGLTPLIKGGEIGALPKDQEMEIRLQTSQRLGHNRDGITTAYSGAFTETGKVRAEKISQQRTIKNKKEGDEDYSDS